MELNGNHKLKGIRNIAHFRNCTGKRYTTVKESGHIHIWKK